MLAPRTVDETRSSERTASRSENSATENGQWKKQKLQINKRPNRLSKQPRLGLESARRSSENFPTSIERKLQNPRYLFDDFQRQLDEIRARKKQKLAEPTPQNIESKPIASHRSK